MSGSADIVPTSNLSARVQAGKESAAKVLIPIMTTVKRHELLLIQKVQLHVLSIWSILVIDHWNIQRSCSRSLTTNSVAVMNAPSRHCLGGLRTGWEVGFADAEAKVLIKFELKAVQYQTIWIWKPRSHLLALQEAAIWLRRTPPPGMTKLPEDQVMLRLFLLWARPQAPEF